MRTFPAPCSRLTPAIELAECASEQSALGSVGRQLVMRALHVQSHRRGGTAHLMREGGR